MRNPPVFDVDWVFGYGSLIWNPEIEFEQAALARLHGWHRAFCVRSTRYRGTADEPGVVLGLDRGGSCVGVAYRLRFESREASIRQLLDREIPDWEARVYQPTVVEVRLGEARCVQALTFVADRARPSYERLCEEEILRRLRSCRGRRGANREYALNTWQALEAHGVRDTRLARLVRRLLEHDARADGADLDPFETEGALLAGATNEPDARPQADAGIAPSTS